MNDLSAAKRDRERRKIDRMVEENDLRQEEVVPADPEYMSLFFNLSYANYLVVNRSKLESMPPEWQEDFIELIREMEKEFNWLPDQPGINVQILARSPELARIVETCDECEGTGRVLDDKGQETEEECPYCDGMGENTEEGDRYETPEEVGTITDPIPHYDRTRTRLPRASMTLEEAEGDERLYSLYPEWLKANYPEVFAKIYESAKGHDHDGSQSED